MNYNIEMPKLIDACSTYRDGRGFFTVLPEIPGNWVGQTNVSVSKPGVLRGMHYQKEHPQAKLVKVLYGRVLDVVVDLRRESPCFKKAISFNLTEAGPQLYVPRGFAHGFYNCGDTDAVFMYRIDDDYHPEDEAGIRWDSIDIDWHIPEGAELILSEKDVNWPSLEETFPE